MNAYCTACVGDASTCDCVNPNHVPMNPTTTVLRDRVATRIKAKRMKLGLSLSEAATRCGLSKAHLSKLEDDCNPSVETLFALAKGYGCEMADLLPAMSVLTEEETGR